MSFMAIIIMRIFTLKGPVTYACSLIFSGMFECLLCGGHCARYWGFSSGLQVQISVCTYSILNSYNLMEDYRSNQTVPESCDKRDDGEAQ